MGHYHRRTARLALVSLAALAVGHSAQAQTAADVQTASDEGLDSEIVVTANKREERLQDVPLSITAVTGEELNDRRIVDIQDLAARVPGLSFQRGSAFGVGQRLILRGLNTGGFSATVASVVDEVPLTISAASGRGGDFAADFDAYDLERIEVLKGPQGNLYGASSLGGLVKYVTKAPDPDGLEVGFDAGLTDIAHGGTGGFGKGFVNVPFGTNAAVRASGYYELMPGWIGNARLGGDKVNEVRRLGGRIAVGFQPTDALDLTVSALYQEREADGYDLVDVRGFTAPTDQFALLNGYNKDGFLEEPNETKSQLYALRGTYDLGGAELQSITSYGIIDTDYVFDTPIYVALSPLPPPTGFSRPNTALGSFSVSSLKKFSQELRLASDGAGETAASGFDWQVGAFYTRETTERTDNYVTFDATTRQPVTTPAAIALTPPGSSNVFLSQLDTRYEEYAAYIDVTYHFSERFDVEVGGRLFHNQQRFTQSTGGAIFSPPTFTTAGPFKSSETRATFALAPRFHITPDAMIYARVASGYRPGGPNITVPPANPAIPTDTPGQPPSDFDADTTVNYEVGFKATLLDRLVSLDIAGFYVDWSDIQVTSAFQRAFTVFDPTINAGDATSKGVEWNVSLNPMPGLTFGLLGAYTDATIDQTIPAIFATEGQQLPFVPKWTTTATADLDVPLSDELSLILGASYNRVGKRFTNFNRRPVDSHIELPAYDTLQAQAGVRFGSFRVEVYGKNLGDTRGITNYMRGRQLFPGAVLQGFSGLIRPRELGLRVSARF